MTFLNFRNVGAAPHPEIGGGVPFLLFALFQLKFAIITPALFTGSMAGRIRFRSYILFMVLFTLFIYAPLAHMTWHPDGLLMNLGVLDFAGGTVVHMSAGFAALAGAVHLGPRNTDRLEQSRSSSSARVFCGSGGSGSMRDRHWAPTTTPSSPWPTPTSPRLRA